jgi:hypothetical protein
MDQKLDQLVAAMNSAKGDARVDAIAATLTELVAQRKAMTARMADVHTMMAGHMEDCPCRCKGAADEKAPHAADCPMMKKSR